MRRLLFSLLMFCVLPAWADGHDQLYKVAGWPEQRAHFNDALSAAQQRYQSSLPPAVFQALVNNSNQRFDPKAVDQRAESQLRKNLADPKPALNFFQSPLGKEDRGRRIAGDPPRSTGEKRQGLAEDAGQRQPPVDHRSPGPGPARSREAGAEVSLAIAGVAADSLSAMIPGSARRRPGARAC